MQELLTLHLDTLLAFISGGGLLTLITIRSTKKKAEAKAMQAVQAVYQETIKDLREDKDLMKKENEDLRISITELRDKINNISLELASIRRYKCTVVGCENRKTD